MKYGVCEELYSYSVSYDDRELHELTLKIQTKQSLYSVCIVSYVFGYLNKYGSESTLIRFSFSNLTNKKKKGLPYYRFNSDEMTYEEFIININSMLRGTKININNELRQYLFPYIETKYKWYLLNKIFLMKGI